MTCPNANRFFLSCKFEPRYDVKEVDVEKFNELNLAIGVDESTAEVIKAFAEKIYIGDVCVKCGTFVKRV